MKGVGSQLGVLLIAEIGDVRRFNSGSARAWMPRRFSPVHLMGQNGTFRNGDLLSFESYASR